MACEGIYADVGRTKKTREEGENKVKFNWMLKMYKKFKTDYVRHFRFNSSVSVASVLFGKNFIYVEILN